MSLFGVTGIGLFVLSGLLLNITPGADLLYLTNRSAIQGKKAGVVAALGIGAGGLVQVLAATFGLSMILVSSSFALFTSTLAIRLKSIAVLPRLLKSLVGFLFIALGIRLAISS